MRTEIIKKYEELQKFEPATLDRNMLQLSKDERQEVLHIVGNKVATMYPTAANLEIYKDVPDEQKLEDFSWKVPGEVIDDLNNIVRPGGMSADYRHRVEMNATYNHWKAFWLAYDAYEQDGTLFPDGIPDFNWHMPHIRRYIFSVLRIEDALKYISALVVKLNGSKGTLVDSDDAEIAKFQNKMYKNLLKELKEVAEQIKYSYDTIKQLEGK